MIAWVGSGAGRMPVSSHLLLDLADPRPRTALGVGHGSDERWRKRAGQRRVVIGVASRIDHCTESLLESLMTTLGRGFGICYPFTISSALPQNLPRNASERSEREL